MTTKYEVQVVRVGTRVWVVAAAFDTSEEAWAFKYEGSEAEANLGKHSAIRIVPPILREGETVPELLITRALLDLKRDDQAKPRFDLIPMRALRSVAVVLALGVPKHGEQGWRTIPASKHFECALRHVVSHALGEKNDPDTGEPHLAHAASRILFMLEEVVS